MEHWQRAEQKIAELFGGKVQPGSGCSQRLQYQNDVLTKDFLVEVKFTRRAAYSVKRSTLIALKRRAAKLGRAPIIACVFDRGAVWTLVQAHANDVLTRLDPHVGSVQVHAQEEAPWETHWLLS